MKLLLFWLFCFNSTLLFAQEPLSDSSSSSVIVSASQQIELTEAVTKPLKPNLQDTITYYTKLLNQVKNDPDQSAQFYVKLADLYFLKKKEKDETVYLKSTANLSTGGTPIDQNC